MIVKTKQKKAENADKLARIMTEIINNEDEIDQKKEHFWVIGVDTRLHIEYIELVSLGNLNQSIVHPREVFRFAIMKGVRSIIVSHNHPSGHLEPSTEDILINDKLSKAGIIIGIEVLDHVIIDGKGGYYSMKSPAGNRA